MVVGVSLSIPKSLILVIFGDASEIKVSLSASQTRTVNVLQCITIYFCVFRSILFATKRQTRPTAELLGSASERVVLFSGTLQADACSIDTAMFACVLPVCAQIETRSDAWLSIYCFQLKSNMVNFSLQCKWKFLSPWFTGRGPSRSAPSSIGVFFCRPQLGQKQVVFRM